MIVDPSVLPSPSGVVAALDVGGTAIKAALADRAGVESHRIDRTTPVSDGVPAVVTAIVDTIEELRRAAGSDVPLRGVGLIFPGLVDRDGGIATYSANIGWRDLPLRSMVSERVGLPVAIDHDVRAGGLAEAQLGAAQGASEALFLPIGTGIAGAVLTGGRVVAGTRGMAGEIGHLPVVPNGERCACGQRGCTETYASAKALARRYLAFGGMPARGSATLRAEDVIARAGQGDVIARQVYTEAIEAIGRALVSYTLLMDPSLIVVGGGLSKAGSALLDPLAEEIQRGLAWRSAPPLVLGRFGADAGRVGAALIGWSAWEAQQ
jgi:glucokinase